MPHAPDATTALWHQFRAGLLRYLRRRLPSEADAEDVLQEVFLRLHEGAERLPQVNRLQSWVYAIARRAVADFYRARHRRPPTSDVLCDEAPLPDVLTAPPPADGLSTYDGAHDVHEEVLSWLLPLIDELPERYRIAVRMADVEGRTQQEVADRLGLSLSGAKSRVQRGRALLGELLQRCCAIEFSPEGRAVAFQRLQPGGDHCEAGCS